MMDVKSASLDQSVSAGKVRVTIIGAETIGLSFSALHLTRKKIEVTIYDTRPNLETYIYENLAGQ